VAKSGRTTGLTCSTVDAIDLDVEVDYFKDCAETQPYYTRTFTGQLGIPGDSFADSGDSGALIVDSRNAQAVGLLFATGSDGGSNGYSVANPIRDVLTELGAQAGQQLSIVGGEEHPVACLNYNRPAQPQQSGPLSLTVQASAKARDALQTVKTTLTRRSPAILGAALGRSADNPLEPAIIIYVDRSGLDKTSTTVASLAIPATINSLRTAIIPADAQSVDSGGAPLAPSPEQGMHLPAATILAAADIQHRYAKQLMSDPAIFGVGVTQSYDNPAEAALLVLVDTHRTARATPATIGGLRVRYVFLDRLHVTKSKFAGAPHPSSCALQSRQPAPWTMPQSAPRIPF
jgi:hypothetical protein